MGSPDDILDRLRAAARRDLGDFMVITVRPDDRHPDIQNDGMKYDGLRFRADCNLAGNIYGRPFGVDVAFGDPILGEPEVIVARDAPELALIATAGPIEATRLRAAIEQTFSFRGTHPVPGRLSPPPETWAAPYAAIAREDRMRWETLAEVFEAARQFLDPVLAGRGDSMWEPIMWTWATGTPGRATG